MYQLQFEGGSFTLKNSLAYYNTDVEVENSKVV
jgi:hypothetical protein